jgi:hypothetical protein
LAVAADWLYRLLEIDVVDAGVVRRRGQPSGCREAEMSGHNSGDSLEATGDTPGVRDARVPAKRLV